MTTADKSDAKADAKSEKAAAEKAAKDLTTPRLYTSKPHSLRALKYVGDANRDAVAKFASTPPDESTIPENLNRKPKDAAEAQVIAVERAAYVADHTTHHTAYNAAASAFSVGGVFCNPGDFVVERAPSDFAPVNAATFTETYDEGDYAPDEEEVEEDVEDKETGKTKKVKTVKKVKRGRR